MSERSDLLRILLQQPQFKALKDLAEEMIHEAKETTTRKKENEFETIYALAEEEGYVRALKELFSRAENEAVERGE